MIHAMSRTNFKALCQVTETWQVTAYCMISFTWHSRKGKTDQWWPGTESVGRWLDTEGNEGTFWDDENVLQMKEITAMGFGWWCGKGHSRKVHSEHRVQFCCLEKQSHLLRIWFGQIAQISFLCSLEYQWDAGKHKALKRAENTLWAELWCLNIQKRP